MHRGNGDHELERPDRSAMGKKQLLAEAWAAFQKGVPTMSAEDILKLMKQLSIDELTHVWLKLPDDQRVVITIDSKVRGAHRGRRSCVSCKGGLTEANQLSVPMKLLVSVCVDEDGEHRDMYVYVLVCSAACEGIIKQKGYFRKAA
jgi:hypothetical protein